MQLRPVEAGELGKQRGDHALRLSGELGSGLLKLCFRLLDALVSLFEYRPDLGVLETPPRSLDRSAGPSDGLGIGLGV